MPTSIGTDPALPQLEVLRDARLMSMELGRAVFAEPTEVAEVTVARHKPGRRCTLRYDVRVGPPGAERVERLYGKTFASDRGPRVYRTLAAIASARACGPDVSLPEPARYLPSLKLLLIGEVCGAPVSRALLGGDTALATRIAEAIHALHSSGLDLERRHTIDEELNPLTDRVTRLCGVCPAVAGSAQRCLTLVGRGRERLVTWRWRPVHRDFYHDQLLIGDQGLAVLDFDDAAMSEPAIDVANFLAHLELLSLETTDTYSALDGVAAAFETRYRVYDPDLDPALVRFLKGATLLRLAEIHLPRRRGDWLSARLLERSECHLG